MEIEYTTNDGARRECTAGWIGAIRRTVTLAALLGALLPALSVARTDILVVKAEQSIAVEEVLGSLRATLANGPDKQLNLRVVTAAEFSQTDSRTAGHNLPDLIVTLGTDAAATVLQKNLPTPTYCTFLPKAAYAVLVNRAGGARAHLSALYLDQPFARQLRLIRLALPGRTRVGVVLSPDSQKSEHELRRAAAVAGIGLRMEQIGDEKQLVGALHRVLDDADVLLAVPDPLVFNRNTAQSVLLTTYRLGKPVAGYSRAYVTAGALLAVYSTPAQIGRQIGEDLLTMQNKAGRPLPVAGYPRYFSVEVNERVARSLGIEPGRTDDLARRLGGSGTEDNP